MKKKVADILLDQGCLQLRPQNPFTYASGLKGPIYCDNRLLISHVSARTEIITCFLELLAPFKNSAEDFDIVAGMATAGIPYAAWVAHELRKPMIYVRSQAKDHGRENFIEGRYQEGQRVILIEDLVNQGKSSVQGVEILQQVGLKVMGLICIVSYEMRAAKSELARRNCPLFELTNFSSLVSRARERGQLKEEEVVQLNSWWDQCQAPL